MGPEMRLTRICCCCCLLYQLGFLSHGTISGLQLTPDLEEWEIVFPALWSRESPNATGLSGGRADPGSGRSAGGGGRGQASGSSREVRSVARAPMEEAAGGHSEPWFASPLQPGTEDEEELESQELPRGSSGDTALSSGAPASWQPPLPPQPPSSPPPAQQEEPSTEEVLLRIPALSRDLYLLLRRDGRFLAQRFAVEQWPKPGPDPTRATVDPRPPMPPDASCFYTGTVLRHPGSLASFSTCGGGLMGFIQLNEDFIFIEPFNDTMAIIGHPHRLYRQKRSTEEKVTENSAVHRHPCGVISDIFLHLIQSYIKFEGIDEVAYVAALKDFCVHKDEPCDTVGIAYLNGMCSEKRKCIIAEDNGLNLAFTIAHEMGHNMGINHDNDHPSCADGLHIMSGEWIKGQNLGDVSWSRCSKEDLERFLRSKASSCLLHTDPQSLSSVLVPSKLPGMAYTADEQCQILFGPLASFCQEMQHVICTGLWCRVEGEAECRTKLDPPMDGTDCDPGKWCKAGECTRRTPAPEHLAGEWSPWSSCSRSCSSGVSSRERKCPGLGSEARDCNGPRKQYRICENPPCPAGLPGFRDWQCQAYSVRTSYPKHALQWQAVFDEEKPCALFCSPVGKEQPVLLSDKVMDGTSCGYQGLDICANGRCQKAGCDGLLGSLAREDHCGVCNGNGKSCKVIKGDFNHTRGAGYVEVLVIPAGARRIKVVEEKPAHSYLALRDASKQSINSDWKIEHSGAFSLAGTTVHYIRRGLWEKISAKGPTTTPLHLLVLLFQDQNYGLHYEYTVPSDPLPDNQSSKEPGPLFMWTHAGWGDCNATCGGGERKTTVSCTKIMSKNISLVDNKKCKDLTKPEPQIRKCNEQPCQTRWMMTEWTTCSRTCGKGVQSRQVACTQQLENGTLIRAWERDCIGPKPATAQRCEGQDCMTVWEAGVWSECSVKCGKGVRHRTVRCTNPRKKCVLSTRPREAEDCEDYSKCYVWRVGDWSKCSITCGKGMQSRVIQCMHKITGRHGNECFSSEKPAAYRPCHLQPCNEKINVNTITSPRLAALTFKCLGDQWPVYCRVIREKNLCQDMRWYQRCCETCRDFYAQKLQQKS
ncbi:A disintegrin and metalloproteinase with thrombospondin motifs 19 [Grammomys surdaster]|uniref:A disintegrin and metalloproteinase with thrombospondin motifs 19 n=1 Tax=Grammomys surdaster TaxID=491861 RepID=UPI00109EFB8D|nr:A disintegrin and metalloproteinase with thrombospondin motifs 19 [Grammomys surdaster]